MAAFYSEISATFGHLEWNFVHKIYFSWKKREANQLDLHKEKIECQSWTRFKHEGEAQQQQ